MTIFYVSIWNQVMNKVRNIDVSHFLYSTKSRIMWPCVYHQRTWT